VGYRPGLYQILYLGDMYEKIEREREREREREEGRERLREEERYFILSS
jgi:hypothetical protein